MSLKQLTAEERRTAIRRGLAEAAADPRAGQVGRPRAQYAKRVKSDQLDLAAAKVTRWLLQHPGASDAAAHRAIALDVGRTTDWVKKAVQRRPWAVRSAKLVGQLDLDIAEFERRTGLLPADVRERLLDFPRAADILELLRIEGIDCDRCPPDFVDWVRSLELLSPKEG